MITGDSTWKVGGPRTSTRWRGKAVVVTETPGVRGSVVDGETGLIVAPRDPVARAGGDALLAGECDRIGGRRRASMRWDD